jgi:hypothetical protein
MANLSKSPPFEIFVSSFFRTLASAEPGAGRSEPGQPGPGHTALEHGDGQHTRHERSCPENDAQVHHYLITRPFQASL